LFWKIYFCFLTVLEFVALMRFWERMDLSLIFNSLPWVALFGFTFEKKLWRKEFWQVIFYLCVIYEARIFVNDVFLHSPHGINISMLIGHFLTIPMYVATFLYAFKNNSLWEPKTKK